VVASLLAARGVGEFAVVETLPAIVVVVFAAVTHLADPWLLFALLIVYFVGVEHPPVVREEPLTPRRRLLGYAAIVIFLLCFSLQPLSIMG